MVEALGCAPGGTVQRLPRRRKKTVGIIRVNRVASPHGNAIAAGSDEPLDGVIGHVRDIGWSLLITYWDGVTAPDAYRMDAMPGQVDGILIDEGGVPAPLLDRLAALVPVVIIGGPPNGRGHDVVTSDVRAGAAAVVTHLITVHGRRRLCHVGGPAGASGAGQWRAALEQVLRDHPGARLTGTVHGLPSEASGEQAAERILATADDQPPDAIVCASDRTAAGLLRAFARAGVRVPEDVAITGFSDACPGRPGSPPLTTVSQPRRLLGKRACARLIDRIEAPDLPPVVELLPGELVISGSCGCPPGALIP